MSRVIKGTKDKRKMQVVAGQKDVRQVRCIHCKSGLASAVPDGKGGTVCRCPNCGAAFDFKAI